MNDEIFDRVRRVVADVMGAPLEAIRLRTSYLDIPAWDSLNIVKLAMAVEAEFGVPISPDDALKFTSVEDILSVLSAIGIQ